MKRADVAGSSQKSRQPKINAEDNLALLLKILRQRVHWPSRSVGLGRHLERLTIGT